MSDQANKIVINVRKTDFEIEYTVEKLEHEESNFYFVIAGDAYTALENEAYYKTKGKFVVEGFRKGKAPKHIIKAMYGQYAFLEETIDMAIDACYQAFYQTVMPNLHLGARLDLKYDECNAQQVAFHFIAVEYPEVENLVYKDLTVLRVNPAEVTDEMVDKKLQDARAKAGFWQDIDNRPVQDGDTVTIDYAGSIDGEFFDGGTAENQELVIGSNTFIPGFEAQLIGMEIGTERDIKVTFPEDYGATELAGKEANFHIKLHAIKVKELPEADDEFAKDVSEYDTLADLLASYRDELTKQEESRAKDATEKNLLDAVVAANDITLNEKIIREAAQEKVDEFKNMLSQSGMTFDDYANYTGVTEEKMLQDYMASCAVSEKRGYILSLVVKAEQLTVTPEEIEAKIAENAEKAGKDVEEYRKQIDKKEYEYMYNSMLSDKLIDFLTSVNTFVDEMPDAADGAAE